MGAYGGLGVGCQGDVARAIRHEYASGRATAITEHAMRIQEPDTDRFAATIHSIYLKIFEGRSFIPRKTIRSVMSELMYADEAAWRVIGVTRAALDRLHRGEKRGFQRAHIVSRAEMVDAIIERPSPMTRSELFEYWQSKDLTVLALRSENRREIAEGWIAFENDDARYFRRRGIGFTHGDLEAGLVQRLMSIEIAFEEIVGRLGQVPTDAREPEEARELFASIRRGDGKFNEAVAAAMWHCQLSSHQICELIRDMPEAQPHLTPREK